MWHQGSGDESKDAVWKDIRLGLNTVTIRKRRKEMERNGISCLWPSPDIGVRIRERGRDLRLRGVVGAVRLRQS